MGQKRKMVEIRKWIGLKGENTIHQNLWGSTKTVLIGRFILRKQKRLRISELSI